MKQPHEDEEHLVKERYGDEDMQAYPGKLDTQSREELNEDKAYLLWTETVSYTHLTLPTKRIV